ncbi:MAG: hypothetical protein WD342_00245 [Verrucomicrobiales bacterium]
MKEYKIKLKSEKDWSIERADEVRQEGDAFLFIRDGATFRTIFASDLEGPPSEYAPNPSDDAKWDAFVAEGDSLYRSED